MRSFLMTRWRTLLLAVATAISTFGLLVAFEMRDGSDLMRAGSDLMRAASEAWPLAVVLLIVWVILGLLWPLD
jgi:hypothetical protein